MNKKDWWIIGIVVLIILVFVFNISFETFSPTLDNKNLLMDNLGENSEDYDDSDNDGDEEIESEECTCPSKIHIITVNGINADLNHPIHKWIKGIILDPSGVKFHPIDPYDSHGIFGENDEWCNADPLAAGQLIDEKIAEIREKDPCAKIIILGHSAGAWGALASKSAGICRVKVDPPMEQYPFGGLFCPFQKGVDKLGRDNMKKNPRYIPLDVHDPWLDENAGNAACSENLKKVKEKIDECFFLLNNCIYYTRIDNEGCPS
jgi:hypothetical protein